MRTLSIKKLIRNRKLQIATAVVGVLLLFSLHYHHRIAPRTSKPFDERQRSDAFVDAASMGDLEKLQKMLDAGISPDASSTGDGGVSALSAAVDNQQFSAVRFLVSKGADVNADDFWGGNALVGASVQGDPKMVEFLLDHGADPNMVDDDASALDYASYQLNEHTEKAPLAM